MPDVIKRVTPAQKVQVMGMGSMVSTDSQVMVTMVVPCVGVERGL